MFVMSKPGWISGSFSKTSRAARATGEGRGKEKRRGSETKGRKEEGDEGRTLSGLESVDEGSFVDDWVERNEQRGQGGR